MKIFYFFPVNFTVNSTGNQTDFRKVTEGDMRGEKIYVF
jgi:hypothetical protein